MLPAHIPDCSTLSRDKSHQVLLSKGTSAYQAIQDQEHLLHDRSPLAAWEARSCLPEGHKGSRDRLLSCLLLLLKDEAPQLLHPCRPELQKNSSRISDYLDVFIEGHRLLYADQKHQMGRQSLRRRSTSSDLSDKAWQYMLWQHRLETFLVCPPHDLHGVVAHISAYQSGFSQHTPPEPPL